MHIGITSGHVYSMDVGGVFSRWETVVSGEPIMQLEPVISDAKPGECVLAPDAWDLVAAHCRGAKLASGNSRLDAFKPTFSSAEEMPPGALPPLDILPSRANLMRMQAYVPSHVLQYLCASGPQGHMAWTNELRSVTTIFFNLKGIDVSEYDSLQEVHEVMMTLQSVIYFHEGAVNKRLRLEQREGARPRSHPLQLPSLHR